MWLWLAEAKRELNLTLTYTCDYWYRTPDVKDEP